MTMANVVPAPDPPPVPRLTPRQREIVAALLDGCSNKAIAQRLGVSDQTIKNQLSTLYRKLGVANRLELVVLATYRGLLKNS
jgi:two-component system nitrate/nitrite response regulator NarL